MLDAKILEKTPDEEVEEEIQQSDIFVERIQLTIIRLTKVLGEIGKIVMVLKIQVPIGGHLQDLQPRHLV